MELHAVATDAEEFARLLSGSGATGLLGVDGPGRPTGGLPGPSFTEEKK